MISGTSALHKLSANCKKCPDCGRLDRSRRRCPRSYPPIQGTDHRSSRAADAVVGGTAVTPTGAEPLISRKVRCSPSSPCVDGPQDSVPQPKRRQVMTGSENPSGISPAREQRQAAGRLGPGSWAIRCHRHRWAITRRWPRFNLSHRDPGRHGGCIDAKVLAFAGRYQAGKR